MSGWRTLLVALALVGCGDDSDGSNPSGGGGAGGLSGAANSYCAAACERAANCQGVPNPPGCQSSCASTITGVFPDTDACRSDLNEAASCFRSASCDQECDVMLGSSLDCSGQVGGDALAEEYCTKNCEAVACVSGTSTGMVCESACEGSVVPDAADDAACRAAYQAAIDCLTPCNDLCIADTTAIAQACLP